MEILVKSILLIALFGTLVVPFVIFVSYASHVFEYGKMPVYSIYKEWSVSDDRFVYYVYCKTPYWFSELSRKKFQYKSSAMDYLYSIEQAQKQNPPELIKTLDLNKP
jgi:hypothetical protein